MILFPDDWEVIRLSLKVAIVGVVLTLPVAFGLAWLLKEVPLREDISVQATSVEGLEEAGAV